ncbi:uncharacterized protein LOC111847890 [Scomber scombrus]|uniref:Uncharacterized protein LOC111847890 n=1 Tax=Scomber scombrus TaxID=13677 RepID=A0AAV1QCB4_SCOSC
MASTSQTKMYDVHLMSNLDDHSRRVLGHTLLPEFVRPGKPTAERIAVEYLLAQSDRGNLLSPPGNEIGATLTDVPLEDQDEECHDVTIPCASDIDSSQRQSSQYNVMNNVGAQLQCHSEKSIFIFESDFKCQVNKIDLLLPSKVLQMIVTNLRNRPVSSTNSLMESMRETVLSLYHNLITSSKKFPFIPYRGFFCCSVLSTAFKHIEQEHNF